MSKCKKVVVLNAIAAGKKAIDDMRANWKNIRQSAPTWKTMYIAERRFTAGGKDFVMLNDGIQERVLILSAEQAGPARDYTEMSDADRFKAAEAADKLISLRETAEELVSMTENALTMYHGNRDPHALDDAITALLDYLLYKAVQTMHVKIDADTLEHVEAVS